ncbi:M1 family metallopeptidase [Candidatus Palauibacter polyketidifaciens]|uniref:M1 family metallopeptidase n=1 Tax=Candidatus Palauibacter polyketidifaciens TaxID=3056740 RepID=UPI002384D243|nr:M1 family metallopeptidase [Candidatus Palauibacter polyketidifaciens]MDE2720907.1 M1 family metallopeptidase [Candidatus Palauibacter polyketidifaciens]
MRATGRGARTFSAVMLLAVLTPVLPQLSHPSPYGGLAAQEDEREEREAAEAAELARRDSLRRIFDPAGAFAPLDLPEPDEFRDVAGAPGEAYWQQRADYHIRVTLDDDRIEGTERITYTNNSPDSLTSLWVQLDQNLFRETSYGAQRAEELGGDVRHGGFFKDGGFVISGVRADLEGEMTVPEYRTEDTMMEILLGEPLPPGGSQLEVEIDFAFEIPETGGDRMGQLDIRGGIIYQLAQWYPRVFTYDDVNGWNQSPFLGQGEWYLEYGDFEVELTVPRDFVVVATGELLNPDDVLTPMQRERLAEARLSEETVHIIGPDEAGEDHTRPPGETPLTWRFRAENVRDFAWATSDRFVWDAAGWEDVLIMSAYPQESIGGPASSGWERSTEYLRHSVRYYSEQWLRYPYPVAINVAGLALGMEYPMIVFCSWRSRGAFLFSVTDHEIGHTWFPMIVGSDERRYAWMDEGFNTFINYYSGIEFAGGEPILGQLMSPAQIATDTRLPTHAVYTPADSIPEADIGVLAYNKPAAVLVLLREEILGPEVFDEGFREYIRRWAYKHPQPADFIRTMEDVSGQDLDWFFRGWIYEDAILDQAIASVTRLGDTTRVVFENRGGIPMPLEVRILFRDGEEHRHEVPVEAWEADGTYVLEVPGGPVRNVQIDPDGVLPDVNRGNNVWGRGILGRRPPR